MDDTIEATRERVEEAKRLIEDVLLEYNCNLTQSWGDDGIIIFSDAGDYNYELILWD